MLSPPSTKIASAGQAQAHSSQPTHFSSPSGMPVQLVPAVVPLGRLLGVLRVVLGDHRLEHGGEGDPETLDGIKKRHRCLPAVRVVPAPVSAGGAGAGGPRSVGRARPDRRDRHRQIQRRDRVAAAAPRTTTVPRSTPCR